MQLHPGIKVFSQNKKFLGRVQFLSPDQTNFALKGLVVQYHRGFFETRYTIVPLYLFWASLFAQPIKRIQLELSHKQFRSLESYLENPPHYSQGVTEYFTWLPYISEVFFYPSLSSTTSPSKKRIWPKGTVQLGRNDQVILQDGTCGEVKEFHFTTLINQFSPALSSLEVKFDFSPKPLTIPIAWIKKMEGAKVFLDLTQAELSQNLAWVTKIALNVEIR